MPRLEPALGLLTRATLAQAGARVARARGEDVRAVDLLPDEDVDTLGELGEHLDEASAQELRRGVRLLSRREQ